MAVHFNARIYGEVQGNPPFQNASGQTAFSLEKPFVTGYAPLVNFPTVGTTVWPLLNGVQVAGMYVYSVIEVEPSGLNTHGKKYVSDSSAATIATAIG